MKLGEFAQVTIVPVFKSINPMRESPLDLE